MASIQDFRDLFIVINDETDRIALALSNPGGLNTIDTTEVLTSLQGAADKLKSVGVVVPVV